MKTYNEFHANPPLKNLLMLCFFYSFQNNTTWFF